MPVKSRLCYQYFRPTDPSDPPVKYTELIGERGGVLVLARVFGGCARLRRAWRWLGGEVVIEAVLVG